MLRCVLELERRWWLVRKERKDMFIARRILSAVVLVIVLIAPAFAQRTSPPPEIALGATLVTPPLPIGPGGFILGAEFPAGSCQVVNVGVAAVLVSVRIFDISGTEIDRPGDGSSPLQCKAVQPLPPNAGCTVWTGQQESVAYCKIAVVGAKDSVRGSLTDLRGSLNFLTRESETSRGTVAAQ
jgi:hypothetical protein